MICKPIACNVSSVDTTIVMHKYNAPMLICRKSHSCTRKHDSIQNVYVFCCCHAWRGLMKLHDTCGTHASPKTARDSITVVFLHDILWLKSRALRPPNT